MSRAYYAALHFAILKEDVLPEIHHDPHDGSHEKTIKRYLKSGITVAARIGYILRDMKNRRESADYDLAGMCTKDEASQQIITAQKVQLLLEQI